jgi:dipeptidyl aminopeptidase/acylaminoacyl peptidase
VPLDGHEPISIVREHSIDAAWAPDGSFVVYSGPDVGTTFSVKAANRDGTPHSLPPLTLTRGARHLLFLPGQRSLVFLKGDIRHKDLWVLDVDTGVERALTQLPENFDIRDFDISPSGDAVVLERTEDDSDIVLMDIPKR